MPRSFQSAVLQIQIVGQNQNSDALIKKLKKDMNYLNLKSFSSDNEVKQFNFWFDVDKNNLDNLIKNVEEITSKNKDVKIQIFSRSGIYE